MKCAREAVKLIRQYINNNISFNQETTLSGNSIVKNINNAKNIAEIMNNAGFDVEYMEMDLSSRESIKSIIKKHKNMEILQCLWMQQEFLPVKHQ